MQHWNVGNPTFRISCLSGLHYSMGHVLEQPCHTGMDSMIASRQQLSREQVLVELCSKLHTWLVVMGCQCCMHR